MRLEGTHELHAPRDKVFAALTDPQVLARCIPGCESLEKQAGDVYTAKLSAGVGAIKGVFQATVRMADMRPPEHYRLIVEGKGQPGFLKGSGDMDLTEKDGITSIHYVGEASVGGLLASVGQRMVESAAKMLAGKFFSALEAEAQK
ncbi:MAG: carbon monoxide dehydrogenase subunit G [Acidobacteriales bacterium]|nr:carbon monoxide dehydrogenase subunit G [Terriglobales bacterium]